MRRKKTKAKRNSKLYKYESSEWNERKSVVVDPEKRGKSELSTSIRLPRTTVTKLRRVAMKKGGIGYQTLIKIWIAERLEEELAA